MFKKLWQHKWFMAALAGVSLFLAFPKFELLPTILFFPVFFSQAIRLAQGKRQAFFLGFLTSFFVMLGGFYWVTFVIHEFGYLPWSVSALVFLGFCGFGALNFPVVSWLAYSLEKRLQIWTSERKRELWLLVLFPALYTVVEYLVPKLFPWYLGHCLYKMPWLIQISEYTGSIFLSFALMSLSGALTFLAMNRFDSGAWKLPRLVFIPLALWGIAIVVSAIKLSSPLEGKTLQVALIQANIGSLEKVAARQGYDNKMRHTLDTYVRLTDSAVNSEPKPDLILWPETAMPFQIEYETGKYSDELRAHVKRWNIPLVTGGYGISPFKFNTDYNTAFLLEPAGLGDGKLRLERYHKNILLAFGEYMPLGETFPSLYKMFPQVSNFERGKLQSPFVMKDGTRLGVTICYEAIVPDFYRKVVKHGVNAVINLTNDS